MNKWREGGIVRILYWGRQEMMTFNTQILRFMDSSSLAVVLNERWFCLSEDIW